MVATTAGLLARLPATGYRLLLLGADAIVFISKKYLKITVLIFSE